VPQCNSPYLLEKHLKSGSLLVCPNNTKKSADEEEQPKPRKRGKKGAPPAEAAPPAAVVSAILTVNSHAGVDDAREERRRTERSRLIRAKHLYGESKGRRRKGILKITISAETCHAGGEKICSVRVLAAELR